ncbi:MAG: heme o synthase [Candidatus Neomarinimicrobiota bacterium]|nr:heme o synthase [Candidatus Neomarinimicrobiota bacterium]MEC9455162.1 heme o synthase [Candidatus Neomarinimicrobiota bacterium]
MITNLIELTKLRIAFLVLTTTVIGFYLGQQGIKSPELLLYTLVGTLLCSAGSSVLNNVIEVETDAKMNRTKDRVLPTKKISLFTASLLGVLFIGFGLAILFEKVNTLTSILAFCTVVSYLALYTPLKKVSWINTSVGAIPGALPPLGGWTAATNSLDPGGWILFFILFFWQHPHFYSIAFVHKEDYARAGLKMLPVIDNGKKTVLHIFMHALILIPVSTLPFFFGISGRIYLVGAYLLSNIYMLCCLPFILQQNEQNAKLIFKTSLYYFVLLFFIILADVRF